MEDGLSESEAIEAVGPVSQIVQQILMETPLPKLVKDKVKPRRSLKVWEIVLLVLGAPLWLSLLILHLQMPASQAPVEISPLRQM